MLNSDPLCLGCDFNIIDFYKNILNIFNKSHHSAGRVPLEH